MENNITSTTITELVKALSKAQAEFSKAVWDKGNPHFKSRYASLESVHEAIKAPMVKHGLAVAHLLRYENGTAIMRTTLFHESGEWMACEAPLSSEKLTPQQMGSLITYYRRYTLCCILAIPSGEEDNDAEITINIQQQIEIEALIGDNEELMHKILSAYKVKKLSEIRLEDFGTIMKKLSLRKNNETN
jgi:hypothetical protein